jgi:hypothetical protein
MKNSVYKSILFVIIASVMTVSCSDFEELNVDKTRMTEVDASSLLTKVIYDSGMSATSYRDIGNYIGQYWTNTSLIDQRHRYDFRGSDSEALYNRIYGILYNIKDLKQKAHISGLDEYIGAAMIMEVHLFNYLTDIFGPVPYYDALNADGFAFSPKFNTQEEIYTANLDSLDKAYDLLQKKPEGSFLRGGDVFYDGDTEKWRKLANSIKLRMLMKMVNVDKSRITELSALINDGELILETKETAAIFFDGRYGLVSSRATGTEGSVALGTTMAELLHETLDPRRPFMANLGTNKEGDPINVDEDGNPVYLGVPSGEDPDIIRQFEGLSAPWSGLNGVTAPSPLMTSAEVNLYIAECIIKGYVNLDRTKYYEAGIKQSCEWWTVSSPEIELHLQKGNVLLSADDSEALKQIWREQYINFYSHGYNGWLNYRRVKYPQFHVGSAMQTNDIMKRMVYPPLLKTINTDNYNEAVSLLDKGDHLLSSGWWSK